MVNTSVLHLIMLLVVFLLKLLIFYKSRSKKSQVSIIIFRSLKLNHLSFYQGVQEFHDFQKYFSPRSCITLPELKKHESINVYGSYCTH